MADVPFGAWVPDQPKFQGPHLRDALGCLPKLKSYGPMPDLAAQSDALSERPRGAVAARDKGGDDVHIYAGTATLLQELNSDGSWTDRSGATYAANSDSDRWTFAQYGDRMIATDFVDDMQYIDMSTGSAFAALPNAPRAKYACAFAGFLFTGYTNDSAFMAKWSALNDSEGWTPGTDQSDEVEFPDGGIITGLGGHDALFYFQEQAIRRLFYVGPPTVMQIDVIERARGCAVPGTLAQLGRVFFYRASDGFYLFDGEASQPIGAEQIDNWWASDADPAYLYRTSAAIDPIRKLYMVNYVSVDAIDGEPDAQIAYNWVSKLWSRARVPCQLVMPALSLGYTLEDLDALYSSIDDMTISLDDPIWTGGQVRFGGFTPDWEFARFAGPAVEARFDLGAVKLDGAGRAFLKSARLLIDTADATLAVKMTEREGDAPGTFGAGVSQQESGKIPLRGAGRFAWFRAVVEAGAEWSHAQGVSEIDAAGAGGR